MRRTNRAEGVARLGEQGGGLTRVRAHAVIRASAQLHTRQADQCLRDRRRIPNRGRYPKTLLVRAAGCLLVALPKRQDTGFVPRPRARAPLIRRRRQRAHRGHEPPTGIDASLCAPERRHRRGKAECLPDPAGRNVPTEARVHRVSACRDPLRKHASVTSRTTHPSRCRTLNECQICGDASGNRIARCRRAARTGEESAHECNTETTMNARHGSVRKSERRRTSIIAAILGGWKRGAFSFTATTPCTYISGRGRKSSGSQYIE